MSKSFVAAVAAVVAAWAVPVQAHVVAVPSQGAAPFVRLVASIRQVQARDVRLGSLTISQPTARPTLGPARSSAAFFTIANEAGEPDRLLKAESGVAESVELHTHMQDGEVMRMRPVANVPVPANGSVALAPGGYHVMLIGVRDPLKAGDSFPLTLTFEKAGKVDVIVDVKPLGAAAAGGMDHGHAH